MTMPAAAKAKGALRTELPLRKVILDLSSDELRFVIGRSRQAGPSQLGDVDPRGVPADLIERFRRIAFDRDDRLPALGIAGPAIVGVLVAPLVPLHLPGAAADLLVLGRDSEYAQDLDGALKAGREDAGIVERVAQVG